MMESKTESMIPFSLDAVITSCYKNVQDNVYAIMPAFIALATAHRFGSANFMTSTKSLVTSVLATQSALLVLEPGLLWLNGFDNTEALNKCAEERDILSRCVVSKALLENLPIATMTLISWDSLGGVEPETNLVAYALQKGVSTGAIGLPIGCVFGGYIPTVLDSAIWSTRFIVKFAALAKTKEVLEANIALNPVMLNSAIYLAYFAIGKVSQEIFHESKLYSQELTPHEGNIGGINTLNYRLAADFMPGNEIASYISAIAIETVDGMLRHSLQRSETTNHATYDITKYVTYDLNDNATCDITDNATNQETAVALWFDDVV